ncbi:MAG: hypothetical protein QM759_07840 [Terricaulis sp.]
MQAASVRFMNAALWPLMIWTSLKHFEEHPADDYVERTTPIVATAIGFWVCAIALVILANPPLMHSAGSIDGGAPVTVFFRRIPVEAISALWFFVPSLYAIGFWLFATRDEAYPR